LELGVRLAKEIGADEHGNTTGKWIAHHLAEKIEAAKTDEAAERECVDLILKLWRAKEDFPRGDPLARYNRILPVIEEVMNIDQRYLGDLSLDDSTDDTLISLINSTIELDRNFSSLLILLLTYTAQRVTESDNRLLELAEQIENTPQIQFAKFVVELGSHESRGEEGLDEDLRLAIESMIANLKRIQDEL